MAAGSAPAVLLFHSDSNISINSGEVMKSSLKTMPLIALLVTLVHTNFIITARAAAHNPQKAAANRLHTRMESASRVLVDTPFTLLDSSSAQEMRFSIPSPGKIVLEAEWEFE